MSDDIDITFDFRADTPAGKDPDTWSPTLRQYHKFLWGRPLPSGHSFELDDSAPSTRRYLYHYSALGEFFLGSDSVIPTYTRWVRMQPIVNQFSEQENEAFRAIGYTIGGMMVWPGRSINGQRSINVERGFNAKIADRMDLTLECVRRYYRGEASPMTPVLDSNADFFRLFGGFHGFVEHFLLQDLLTEDGGSVDFIMPFNDFVGRSTPGDVETYKAYREKTISFINARNRRIQDLARQLADSEEVRNE